MITQGGEGSQYAPWDAWLVRPRTGIVGICAADAAPNTLPAEVPNQELKFCVTDTDCAPASGIFCQKASDGDLGAGVCINRANGGRTRCHVDRDCAPAGVCQLLPSCNLGVCKASGPGTFFDHGGLACQRDGDCVPAGTCSPPKVVYAATSTLGSPKRVNGFHVFEVHSDPDTERPLGAAALGGCLACLFRRCAERWEDWPAGDGIEPEDVARCLDPQHIDPGYPGVPVSACAAACTPGP
jgi:hypothetical protein